MLDKSFEITFTAKKQRKIWPGYVDQKANGMGVLSVFFWFWLAGCMHPRGNMRLFQGY